MLSIHATGLLCRAHLETTPGLTVTARAYENVPYTPVDGVPYLMLETVPAGARRLTYGGRGEGRVQEDFLYVVTCFAPKGTGQAAVLKPLEAIRNHFAIDTVLDDGHDTQVMVQGDPGPFFSGGIVEQPNAFARCQLSIPLTADTRA